MNSVVERIEEMKKGLESKRGSGQTRKMVSEVVEYSIKNPGKKVLVVAHTQDFANEIRRIFLDTVCSEETVRSIVGHSVGLINGTVIVFKSEDYQKDVYYKYMKWDKKFEDHHIEDLAVQRLIFDMENEIKTPVIIRRRV
jgi:hypothetical protein